MMETQKSTYPAHEVRQKLADYGYRENHQEGGRLFFYLKRHNRFISIPIDKPCLSRQDILRAVGVPTYYDIIWNLGK